MCTPLSAGPVDHTKSIIAVYSPVKISTPKNYCLWVKRIAYITLEVLKLLINRNTLLKHLLKGLRYLAFGAGFISDVQTLSTD